MISICAWCTTIMREKEPFDDPNETHGICPPCAKKHFGMTDDQIDRALAHEPRTTTQLIEEVVTTALCVLAVLWFTSCAPPPIEHHLHVRCSDGVKLLSVDAYVEAKDCAQMGMTISEFSSQP